MKTEHIYSKHRTREMRIIDAAVSVSYCGNVVATLTREDGRSMRLFMTREESEGFAAKFANPEVPAPEPLERNPRHVCHDATVETIHGVAQLVYLGCGRYRVADGAAVVARSTSGHNGQHWIVEGSRAKYATRLDAVTHIMENL